jgi:NAD-dependent deacetylase
MSIPTALDPDLRQFREMIDSATEIAFFTGAGISTESGIPDFRSPGGVWTRTQPVQFNDFVASEAARRKAWQQKLDMRQDMETAEPNRGHLAIARLFALGKSNWLITQNIDGLHERAGTPADRVIELHGNSTYAKCLDCGLRHELTPILTAFEVDGTLPHCEACGGLVKTATISFGQAMPQQPMELAEKACRACDLFVAVGSSLQVYPAANFPVFAKQQGAKLVILNRDPTDLDPYADLVLNREIGPTLGAAVGLN